MSVEARNLIEVAFRKLFTHFGVVRVAALRLLEDFAYNTRSVDCKVLSGAVDNCGLIFAAEPQP